MKVKEFIVVCASVQDSWKFERIICEVCRRVRYERLQAADEKVSLM